ncbi:DNA-binding response regulator [Psychrobacter sp. YP14]|jgi:DNA-binding NarL/FixJ family response regulator|uniref:Response regulator n=3 Tax=Psychrobacter TaxID=497 RepID=A0A844M1K5_9GAMM|nr:MULTISPECIES: response regulator [Psychrobacter]AWT49220.1 DNA-binding response regulator [Psychrobacter sp. YP14]MUG32822.1 response regulator [Psychrobacter sanguinis]
MIKVLVVDDHDLVRMGISRMLADDPEIEVIGEADSGEAAIRMVKALSPDVVLLDVNMPNIGGVETTKRLRQFDEKVKILAVSSVSSQPYPSMLLKAGVNGYITKGTPLDEMIKAIKKVYQGSKYFSSDVAEQLADMLLTDNEESPFDRLSEREKQVAMMVVNCQSPQQIADQLFVSVKTVNTYRYRIFEKVGVDSDVKLTHLAMRHGLITP